MGLVEKTVDRKQKTWEDLINERPHKKLIVWSKSIDFVTLIYEETKQFLRDEEYGLKS